MIGKENAERLQAVRRCHTGTGKDTYDVGIKYFERKKSLYYYMKRMLPGLRRNMTQGKKLTLMLRGWSRRKLRSNMV
jgi:hypothetical protein